jgi:hypothetical protein
MIERPPGCPDGLSIVRHWRPRCLSENPRGGCAHQGRERHMTMRHQTTSFQLLNSDADVEAFFLFSRPCSRRPGKGRGCQRLRAVLSWG